MTIKGFLKDNAVSNGIYFLLARKKAVRMLAERGNWGQMQRQWLADILNYARNNSAYYCKYINDDITPDTAADVLKTLPLLTKDIIRKEQAGIYSKEITAGWSDWANTGGSTGEPLKFPRKCSNIWNEPICQFITYSYLNDWKGMGVTDTIVSISGCRIEQDRLQRRLFYNKARNFPWGRYDFSTLYMADENLPYYVEQINSTKATYMRGYSAGVLTLAQYIRNHGIALKIHLKGIYLTSEAFAESSRRYISEVFKCPVIGQYGHTEMSVYAHQHKDDSVYECLPFYGYTEIVDESGQHVAEGESGEITVTGFNQTGLPFIRYKTGDIATYRGTDNGVVMIDAIQGRTVDYLVDRSGKKVFLTGAIFGGHIKAFNHIAQWQLLQSEKGKVRVDVIKGNDYSNEVEDEITRFFAGFDLEAELNYVDSIKKQPNGKQKFLIQEIK